MTQLNPFWPINLCLKCCFLHLTLEHLFIWYLIFDICLVSTFSNPQSGPFRFLYSYNTWYNLIVLYVFLLFYTLYTLTSVSTLCWTYKWCSCYTLPCNYQFPFIYLSLSLSHSFVHQMEGYPNVVRFLYICVVAIANAFAVVPNVVSPCVCMCERVCLRARPSKSDAQKRNCTLFKSTTISV